MNRNCQRLVFFYDGFEVAANIPIVKKPFIVQRQLNLTENHREMKLGFLKWHNLSLLYIWNDDQIK